MAADFNAGSIEGTLDLDATPFRAGLARAREDAARFEHEDIEPNLGLDKKDFDVEKDRAKEQLDALGAKKAEPEVKLKGVAGVLVGLGLVRHEMKKTEREGGLAFGGAMVARIALMTVGILGLGAAMGPLTAAVVGFAAAGALAFGGLIPGIALFALSIKSALGPVLAANKAGKELSGWAGKVQKSLGLMTGAWKALQNSVRPEMFKFLNVAFSGIADLLPRLAPLLRATTRGMTSLVHSVLAFTHTKGFAGFLHQLSGFTEGFLKGAGPVIRQVLSTFVHLFRAFRPLMSELGHGIQTVTKATAHWSKTLAHGGIKPFLGYIAHFLPMLGHLAHDLLTSLGHIGKALAPLSGPAIGFLDALVKQIGQLNLGPIAKSLGDLLTSLAGALPTLRGALNLLVPMLSKIIEFAAKLLSDQKVVKIILLVAAALGVWTAAQAALNIVLDANPIGLLIVALGALVVGLVYAYDHSKKFRDIVNGAFHAVKAVVTGTLHFITHLVQDSVNFIKAHWQLLLSILTGPIGAAVIFLITHFSQIKNGFENLMSNVAHAVSTGIDNVVHFFTGLPGRILSLDAQFVHAGLTLMGKVFSGLKTVGSEILSWAAGLPAKILAAIGNIGAKVASSVKNSITSHLPSIHLPHLAGGGVTSGKTAAIIGDNPSGREAVIPLDQYDLPRKGEAGASAAQAHADNAHIIGLLATIAAHMAKGSDHEALAEALGKVLNSHSDAQTRRMLQIARTA